MIGPALIRDCIRIALPDSEISARHAFARAILLACIVESGGFIPDDWRRVCGVLDLTALVECLTHDRLPEDIADEVFG